MLGWPDNADRVMFGGRLALLPGLMVFVPDARPRLADRGGVARPTAVGWPRADIVEAFCSVASTGAEGPIGATIRTDVGRDETVHEHGMTPQRSVYGGASRAYASSRPYGVAPRSSDSSGQTTGSPSVRGDVSRETSGGTGYVSSTYRSDASGHRVPTGIASVPGGVPAVEFTPPLPTGAAGSTPAAAASPSPQASPRLPSPRPHPTQASAPVPAPVVEPHSRYGASEGEVAVESDSEDPPLAMEAMRAVQILNPSGEVTMPRPARPRVMCVANQKGGVGKTTTTVNLAVALALHGNRVVVIDLDPQGNASTGLNVPHHAGVPDVYDCLIDNVPLEDVAQVVEGIPNLWCVPATIDLAGAEIELVSVVARESRLGRAISAYPGAYDYIFIDCPPSLGLLTVNALVAAQEVLIPIQCEYYALEGLNQLLNNINLVKAHLNPELDVSTILLTMYDRRTRLADAVEQDVRNHFGDKVLTAVIPRNVRVSEAPSYGQSVMTYDPGSRGATSYFEAAQEIAERGAKIGVSA
jgi:chromosome partitioning protein